MSEVKLLVSLRLEGRVVLSLISGLWGLSDYPKRFTELRQLLGVSDPGLSKALRRLQAEGIIERTDLGYRVNPRLRNRLSDSLRSLYSLFLLERMRLVVEDLQRFNQIISLVVFGSVAQGRADYDSDVDLLVVVEKWDEPLELGIREAVSKLTVRLGVPIEPVVLSTSGLRILLRQELQFLFGILEGYIVLYDKADIAEALRAKEEEVESRYEYHREVPIWMPRTR